MQRLQYAFPLESRSQWLHMDVDARMRAMLTVFMPEEYEGQHQMTQINRLGIELFMLSNNLELHDGLGSAMAHNERLLAMIRNFGWHKGGQFKSLLASQEPTVEAIVEKIFASAVFQMDIKVMKVILEAEMNPNSLIKSLSGHLFTPLQWAATIKSSRGAKMAELLISHKADIELVQEGRSALLEAILENNEGVIQVLLRHNVVVNLRCLEVATSTVDANLFEKLWKSCPHVNSLVSNTMIQYGAERGNITLLGAAARSGRLEIVKTIFRICPSLVNPRELEATGGVDYFSPISVAIANDDTEALKVLLDAGVDTHFVNWREEPPIEQALARHNLRAYQILVESGATITQPLSYGRLCVLMRFISGSENCPSTMKQLIDESAQLSDNFTEWSGEVLAEAINQDDLLVIRPLLDSGATVTAEKVTDIWNAETAQYLDARGALQAILDGNGPEILLRALELGKWDLAQWLFIREYALLDESLYSCYTPLCNAANSKKPELVKLMLILGATVTDHALCMATRCIKEDLSVGRVPSDEGYEVLRILLSHFNGPAPSTIAEAGYGRTDFRSTNEDMDQDIYLLELLLSEGVEPTGTPEAVFSETWHGLYEPQSALEIVVAGGNRLALDILTQTPYNWGTKALGRALVVACSLPDKDLIDSILKRKPNMNEEVGFWRCSPNTLDWKGFVTFSTALQVAVRSQNASAVRKLLGFTDTNVKYPAKGPHGRTALQHAVENANVELIVMLLSHDADVNSATAEEGGATALQLAAIKGYLGIARRLLDLGADVSAPGAVIGGRTALEGAAENGRIDMVHILIDEGALICGAAGEKQYEKAVKLAIENGHYAVARMLERSKSNAEQSHMQAFNIYVDGGDEVYEEEEHLIM